MKKLVLSIFLLCSIGVMAYADMQFIQRSPYSSLSQTQTK